jgi:hypothetical protein
MKFVALFAVVVNFSFGSAFIAPSGYVYPTGLSSRNQGALLVATDYVSTVNGGTDVNRVVSQPLLGWNPSCFRNLT